MTVTTKSWRRTHALFPGLTPAGLHALEVIGLAAENGAVISNFTDVSIDVVHGSSAAWLVERGLAKRKDNLVRLKKEGRRLLAQAQKQGLVE